jgi:hypothetical protein
MPAEPLQNVILIDNGPFISLNRAILVVFLISNPKYARQDFPSPIFARLVRGWTPLLQVNLKVI